MKYLQIALSGLILPVFMALAACDTTAGGGKLPGETEDGADRLRVIVEFAVPSGPKSDPAVSNQEALEYAREKTEATLTPLFDETTKASIRHFQLLPIFSLEVDGETLIELLRRPEVISVQADQQGAFFDQPGFGLK